MMKAPCEHACPAGVDVPAYVTALAEGQSTLLRMKDGKKRMVLKHSTPVPSAVSPAPEPKRAATANGGGPHRVAKRQSTTSRPCSRTSDSKRARPASSSGPKR